MVWSGIDAGPPADSSEPGGELEVWAHQHRSEGRLQIQRGGHVDADRPQQRPVPRPCRWRRFKTPGCLTSCCMVCPHCRIYRFIYYLKMTNINKKNTFVFCVLNETKSVHLILFWSSSLILCLCLIILSGMQSSKKSFGRSQISHRNLKMEVKLPAVEGMWRNLFISSNTNTKAQFEPHFFIFTKDTQKKLSCHDHSNFINQPLRKVIQHADRSTCLVFFL